MSQTRDQKRFTMSEVAANCVSTEGPPELLGVFSTNKTEFTFPVKITISPQLMFSACDYYASLFFSRLIACDLLSRRIFANVLDRQ